MDEGKEGEMISGNNFFTRLFKRRSKQRQENVYVPPVEKQEKPSGFRYESIHTSPATQAMVAAHRVNKIRRRRAKNKVGSRQRKFNIQKSKQSKWKKAS